MRIYHCIQYFKTCRFWFSFNFSSFFCCWPNIITAIIKWGKWKQWRHCCFVLYCPDSDSLINDKAQAEAGWMLVHRVCTTQYVWSSERTCVKWEQEKTRETKRDPLKCEWRKKGNKTNTKEKGNSTLQLNIHLGLSRDISSIKDHFRTTRLHCPEPHPPFTLSHCVWLLNYWCLCIADFGLCVVPSGCSSKADGGIYLTLKTGFYSSSCPHTTRPSQWIWPQHHWEDTLTHEGVCVLL